MEVDLSRLGGETAMKVDEVLRHDFNQMLYDAARRQQKIACENMLHRPPSRDGFGGKIMQLDAVFDALWRTCYGHNYTEDKDLMKFLERRNPEIVCRPTGTKIMVGWAPCSASKRPVGVPVTKL